MEMEGFVVHETENNLEIKGKPSIEATKISFGNTTRKKLADISNLPQQGRALAQDEKLKVMPIVTKEYIDHLQKENLALMKILAERNKLIEVTRIELQKMRVNIQKMQQQNLQLAQSNSQMLVELNSGKDRLKALQHELGCKNGLLTAKKLEVEESSKVKKCEKIDDEVKLTNCEAMKRSSKEGRDDDKLGNAKRRPKSKSLEPSRQVQLKDEIENKRPCTRRQSARFKTEELKTPEDLFEIEGAKYSICLPNNDDNPPQKDGSTSAGVSHQNEDTEVNCAPRHETGNKRPCMRRQSARFKSEEPKPPEDLFEVDDAKFSVNLTSYNVVPDNVSTSTSISSKNEDTDGNLAPGYEAEDSRRSSIDRPLRQAAKKVHSYKEIPLNIKMRRSD